MAAVGNVLAVAAKHLGVSPVSQAPTAGNYLVLEAEFNGLMHELSANFDLLDEAGDAYTHTDQTTGDTFALGDRFVTGVGAMVAERSAPQVGDGIVRGETRVAAGRGYGLLVGAFGKAVTQDAGLLRKRALY